MTQAMHKDVVILGGGINGAGLFRELCAQGLDVMLVDKQDFGSGTSAAPSRLIHGGLKYLETGEFGLVAQSTLERNLLLKNAPHFVVPLPTVIPIFSWTKGIWAAISTLCGSTTAPRSRGAILIKIGLALYDYYGSRNQVMPKHKFFGKNRSLCEMPKLTKSIVAIGTYYDAKINHPERLVYELIDDGLALNNASNAENYTKLINATDGILTFEDKDGNSSYKIKTSLVVNASGPWIDDVNTALGASTKLIGGTKGSHILLKNDALIEALQGQMIYFEADDGRICLVFDYLGSALVGSTDSKADNPDSVSCEDDEIDYLLTSLQSLLPEIIVNRQQIIYVYSGIRPLPTSDSSNPGLISRDHSAPVIEPRKGRPFPIISLVGGKWTTFRGFAEEVTDNILIRFSLARKTSTRSMPIGGGKDFPENELSREAWLNNAVVQTNLSKSRLEKLLYRYGTKAMDILSTRSDFSDDSRLPDSDNYSLLEVDYICRHENIKHLLDIVMRRTTLAITGSLTTKDLEKILPIAAAALDWNDKRCKEELDQTILHLNRDNRMKLKNI